MEMVEVDGLHIAYERAGSGPALVLLHGYVGDGTTTWPRQLDGLSDEFTVIAWDAPGAGRSTDPPEGFGLDEYADCLAGFLEKLGLDTAHVAGLSFGGILALALQRRHSVMSSALVLASALDRRACRQAAELRFSIGRMVADHVSLYSELLLGRTPSPGR